MISKTLLFFSLFWLLELLIVYAVPLERFYPYGYAIGDTVLPNDKHDAGSPEIQLRVPIKFYGDSYNSLYVNGNGLISFLISLPQFVSVTFPLDYPVLAALYTNVDNRGGGHVFYREDSKEKYLSQAASEILRAFPQTAATPFRPSSLFITTWDRVTFSSQGSNQANTFQVVIASSGSESYVQFLYADDGIQWLQAATLSSNGVPDAKAQAGLTAYNGRTYILPGSGSDQIRSLSRLSNMNDPGVWIFRVGDVGSADNVEIPDLRKILTQVSRMEGNCATGFSLCHSQATCVDSNQQFCCVCRPGFYGNGYTCLKDDLPLRANGKVTLDVNGIRVTDQNLQAYVVVSEGRPYAAITKVPQSIGYLSQVLYPITATLNWLFAIRTNKGLNGFQITGGVLEHVAEITFKETKDKVSVEQKFFGLDVYDHLKVEMKIMGTVPSDLLEKIVINDYQTQFNFLAPGLFRSSSSSLVYKITSAVTHEEVQREIALEQTIKFNESCILEFNSLQASQTNQYSYYRMKTARNFVTYEAAENILRFAATNKVSLLTENEDPCVEGRVNCVVNSSCVVEGDTFKCLCNSGFRPTYKQSYVKGNKDEWGCLDINECSEGRSGCDENAICINEIGSYQCACKQGYTGNGFQCSEIESPCGKDFSLCNPPNSFCETKTDYRTCNCYNGFHKKYVDIQKVAFLCIDKDECESRPCGPNAQCKNLEGSYSCDCNIGYVGDGLTCRRSNVTCEKEQNCSPNGECIFNVTTQRYTCRCIKGYYGDGYHCQSYGGRRVVPPMCLGTECTCPPNFVTISNLCIEREYTSELPSTKESISCNTLTSMCHPNAQCVYNSTSVQYYCACNSGFEGNGFECNEVEVSCLKNDICDEHATCQVNNITGKASCMCNSRYQGDGTNCIYLGVCYSDNECKPNEECHFNEETYVYECRCKSGFVKDTSGFCQTTSLCLTPCYATAVCTSDAITDTSYCKCPPGYRGDGITYCEKVPPTCNILNNCSPYARCEYNLSSNNYECHCKRGYSGNGIQCDLAVSCLEMPEVCGPNSRCVPTVPSYGYSSYQCQCNPNFVQNGSQCTEITTHDGGFLMVNWGTATLRVPYEPSIINPVYPIQLQPNQIAIGLTIDCKRNAVFWTDYYGQKLKSSNFKGKNVTTVVQGNITAPEGVTLDPLNQILFWTDSGRKVIEAINVDGSQRRIIISKNLTNPRGIAVDPYRRKLFWSDWSRAGPKIEWSSFDGSERAVFVSGPEVQLPNSVVIDTSTDELCWADAGTKCISCIGIDNKQQRIITNNCVSPFGLAVSSNKFYWTEKTLSKLGYYDKYTKKSGNITLPSIGTGTLYGIVDVPEKC